MADIFLFSDIQNELLMLFYEAFVSYKINLCYSAVIEIYTKRRLQCLPQGK